jgi:hypothetical protein
LPNGQKVKVFLSVVLVSLAWIGACNDRNSSENGGKQPHTDPSQRELDLASPAQSYLFSQMGQKSYNETAEFLELAKSKDELKRKVGLLLLAHLADPKVIGVRDTIIKALDDPDPWVQSQAMEAVSRLNMVDQLPKIRKIALTSYPRYARLPWRLKTLGL